MSSAIQEPEDCLVDEAFVRKVFGWKNPATVWRRVRSGFLSQPAKEGRHNRWLKSEIYAKRDQLVAEARRAA